MGFLNNVKESFNKLDGRKKKLVIGISCGALVVMCTIGGVVVYKFNGTSSLTKQLGVKDARESSGVIKSPYGIDKEKFTKVINNDEYIKGTYKLDMNMSYNQLSNEDNVGKMRLVKSDGLYGLNKDNNIRFNADIKSYNNFDKPTSLTITYRYKTSDKDKVKNSVDNVVGELFNKKISKYITENKRSAFVEDVKSKSEEYNLRVAKVEKEGKDYTETTVEVSYDKVNNESYNIDDVKERDGMRNLYKSIDFAKDKKLSEVAKSYSDKLGEYNSTDLMSMLNMVQEGKDYKLYTNMFTLRTLYDDSGTGIEYTINQKVDKSDKRIGSEINIKTSTRYRDNKDSAIYDAMKTLNVLIGSSMDVKKEELGQDKIEREVSKEIGDYKYTIKATIDIEDRDGRFYTNIDIKGK